MDRSSGRAEAAKPRSAARESGGHAAAGSAGNAPDAGSDGAAAELSLEGLSLKGQPCSSDADTGVVRADGSPPVATLASNAVAKRKVGRQPADPSSTQRETSGSTHTACAGTQHAVHDSQTPDVAQVCSWGLIDLTPPATTSWLCHPSQRE